MIKKKYILVLIYIAALIIALNNQSFTGVYKDELKDISQIKDTTDFERMLFKYDSLLCDHMYTLKTVGAALAVVHNDSIEFLKCYGVKEVGTNDSINENTIFRLASVSKTFAGVLAGILDYENTLKLDEKVVDIIPGFKLKDSINTHELTVRHILSHSSGLVPHAYDNLVEAHIPFSQIMDSLKNVNISSEPGKLYGYQNVVYSLFDTLSSVKTHKKYSQLLSEKVFIPFKMNDASTGFESFKNDSNKAFPHVRDKKLKLNDRYYNTLPAAGVNASILDMANYMLTIIKEDSTLLCCDVKDKVLMPQIISPLKYHYLKRWDRNDIESKHYALGWRIIRYKGRTIAYHGGYVRGYRAEIAICREDNIGVAFLTNSTSRIASESVPEFLNSYFSYSDKEKEKNQEISQLSNNEKPY